MTENQRSAALDPVAPIRAQRHTPMLAIILIALVAFALFAGGLRLGQSQRADSGHRVVVLDVGRLLVEAEERGLRPTDSESRFPESLARSLSELGQAGVIVLDYDSVIRVPDQADITEWILDRATEAGAANGEG